MTTDDLVEQAFKLSCDDQHRLASRIAGNVGYVLAREDAQPIYTTQAPRGCVCPVGAEKTCRGLACPRREIRIT